MGAAFTFIDYIVEGIVGTLDRPAPGEAPRILSIGDNHPVGLMDMIATLEAALGARAVKVMRPMQPGDVTATYANIDALAALHGYRPKVMLADGPARLAAWYRHYPGLAAEPRARSA